MTQPLSGAAPAERVGELFSVIEEKLADARDSNRRRCQEFFTQLEPRLSAAREIDRELNRHLAHHFNVFRYLRSDELGLSRIIADLLNPEGSHGQGPLFLRTLLNKLKLETDLSDTDLNGAKVVVERTIEEQRRIDIYVEVPSGEKRYVLAIENKPYADDQNEQVMDYLKHLKERPNLSQFHLIYLSPTGEPPSEESLPKAELEEWRDRLLIMPYHHRRTDDEWESEREDVEEFQAPCSLAQWLAACRAQCQAQRLRWFLSDAESYCRRVFGGADMADDLETKTVIELLESNPCHLETARLVYQSWPTIRDRIGERFLGYLADKVKGCLSEFKEDIRVKRRYEGEGRGARTHLTIYRTSWLQHPTGDPAAQGRTSMVLGRGGGVNAWFWYGVRSPSEPNGQSSSNAEQFMALDDKLRSEFPGSEPPDGDFPVWQWTDEGRANWNQLVPKLHEEAEKGGGEITTYYVETLVNFAKRAMPIISSVEGSKSSQN